jgi:hypothetical protein
MPFFAGGIFNSLDGARYGKNTTINSEGKLRLGNATIKAS